MKTENLTTKPPVKMEVSHRQLEQPKELKKEHEPIYFKAQVDALYNVIRIIAGKS